MTTTHFQATSQFRRLCQTSAREREDVTTVWRNAYVALAGTRHQARAPDQQQQRPGQRPTRAKASPDRVSDLDDSGPNAGQLCGSHRPKARAPPHAAEGSGDPRTQPDRVSVPLASAPSSAFRATHTHSPPAYPFLASPGARIHPSAARRRTKPVPPSPQTPIHRPHGPQRLPPGLVPQHSEANFRRFFGELGGAVLSALIAKAAARSDSTSCCPLRGLSSLSWPLFICWKT